MKVALLFCLFLAFVVSKNVIVGLKHAPEQLASFDKAFWDISDPRSSKYGQFLSNDEIKSFLGEIPVSYKEVIKDFERHEIKGEALLTYAVYRKIRDVLRHQEKINFEQLHELALKYKVLTPWSSILAVNASE